MDSMRCDKDVDDVDDFVGSVRLVEALLLLLVGFDFDDDDVSSAYQIPPTATHHQGEESHKKYTFALQHHMMM